MCFFGIVCPDEEQCATHQIWMSNGNYVLASRGIFKLLVSFAIPFELSPFRLARAWCVLNKVLITLNYSARHYSICSNPFNSGNLPCHNDISRLSDASQTFVSCVRNGDTALHLKMHIFPLHLLVQSRYNVSCCPNFSQMH